MPKKQKQFRTHLLNLILLHAFTRTLSEVGTDFFLVALSITFFLNGIYSYFSILRHNKGLLGVADCVPARLAFFHEKDGRVSYKVGGHLPNLPL